MTAITLNLLAEEQQAQHAEARDPFKITLFIGIVVLALTLLAGFALAHFAERARHEANALADKLDSAGNNPSQDTGGDTKTFKSLADDLIAISRARQLYAEQLALIKNLVPNSVQLARLQFALNLESLDTAAGDGDQAKPAKRAPKNAERLSLQLDGRAISSRPEIEVDQFIKGLRNDATFSSRVREIKLLSISRSPGQGDAGAPSVPSVSFVIACQYKERK